MKAKTNNKQRTQAKRTKAVEAVLPPPEQRGLGAYAPDLSQVDPARTTAQAVRVPLDLIDVPAHLDEIPLDEAEARSISATVRSGGLIHPISLRPKLEGRYELVAGRHRLAAHRLAGLPDVLALVRGDWDDQAALVARAVENLRRRHLSPYEEARGYRDMLEAKLSPEQVAEACQVGAKVVRDRLKLLALPVDVGVRLGSPEVPLSHAKVLLQLVPYPDHFAVAKKVLGKLDFDKRPLTAKCFADAVAAELRSKRLVQELGTLSQRQRGERYPAFAKVVKTLRTVELGYTTFCPDPKEYRKAAQPFIQKDREAREKAEVKRLQQEAHDPGTKPERENHEERERQRGFREAYYAHEHDSRIVKSAKGLLGLDGALGPVALESLRGVMNEVEIARAVAVLSEATGASPSEIADVLDSADEIRTLVAFVERLCANEDRLPLARFLHAAALLRMESRWGSEWEHAAQTCLAIEGKAIQKDADKAYKAWVKDGCGPLPWEPAEEVEVDEEATPPVSTTAEPVTEAA